MPRMSAIRIQGPRRLDIPTATTFSLKLEAQEDAQCERKRVKGLSFLLTLENMQDVPQQVVGQEWRIK